MHIWIVNLSQMLTDMANIAIASIYKVAFGLCIDIPVFTLDLGPF